MIGRPTSRHVALPVSNPAGETLGEDPGESGADTVSDDTLQTTDATPGTIATYTTLADERSITMRALVWCREPTTDDSAKWIVECEFNRATGGVVTELDTNFLTKSPHAPPLWDVTFVVSSQDILVKVTGEAGKTIEWRCILEVSEHGA